MRKNLVILTLTTLMLGTLALPAVGGPSWIRSAKKLDRRINNLERRLTAASQLLLIQDGKIERLEARTLQTTPAQELIGTNYETGAAGGSVRCPAGSIATGGGASFMRPQNGDHIVYSAPWVESGVPVGWEAAGVKVSGSTIDNLSVEAICVAAP